MKTASKVLLIISGVLGILISIAFLFLSAIFGIGYIAETVAGLFLEVRQLTILSSFDEVSTSLISGLIAFGIGGLVILLFLFDLIIGFLFTLLGSIFSLVSCKKKSKKAFHILSIVFHTLGMLFGLPFLYFGTLYLLYFIILFVVMLILLITPIGWLIVSFIAVSIGGIFLFNIMLAGNILGLIALAKQKKQEELESQELIENNE